MAGQDLVRPSRDGDQFHYHWAARQCLQLLPGSSDLVAVTIEGPSILEAPGDEIEAGEELIDVGLYYAHESLNSARLVRHVQLKHSTRHAIQPWTTSGLRKTIQGFAKRYTELLKRFAAADVARRFRFEFTTNRPIDPTVQEALTDLASGATPRHQKLCKALVGFTELGEEQASQFFKLFSAEGEEGTLWAQRNLLTQDISAYLPDADYDAPVQLKELVTRKATTEFESDPSIRQHDVLRALKTTEDHLQPARCEIVVASHALPRDQEAKILQALLIARNPLVIHAEGGVGKSVLAARLAASMPDGSEAILYDCYGDGLYRTALHFRHRHRDALVQIANELAAKGLCHPLIPTTQSDVKAYMRAFLNRLVQASGLLRARNPEASLCLLIDAADNAEMAAEEQGEPASFVRDLIRTPLPEGVRLAFTCRTHRRCRLAAPPEAKQIELHGFSKDESARHLRGVYPSATAADVAEFAFLSSANPRVQALAFSHKLSLQDMLRQLGPHPTTVDRTIRELLEKAVTRLRDQAGSVEASQVDLICQGLAVLRPLVPISVLALLSGTSESAVRSFALDLGRPLLVKGGSLHFLDEPAETWFREYFQPNALDLSRFLERLRPLAARSSYVAAVLPQLLLQAGRLDEVVELALSGKGLPLESPLAKRDVELQRFRFALKACLQQGRHLAAAKLALKAAGECAGEQRQNTLIQDNTDLAAQLMALDRIEEIVSRRTFRSSWMGSHHAYDAGLLSGRDELSSEASSRLRMAVDWLRTWARLSKKESENERVTHEDRAELSIVLLRLRGPREATTFLGSWRPRHLAFEASRRVGKRLIDLGRYDQLDSLAEAAGNNVWLLLGLASNACAVGHVLPAKPMARLLRLLGDRRVKLENSQEWNSDWSLLYAVTDAIEIALRILPPEPDRWAAIIRRYLPIAPPSNLTSRFGFDRAPLLQAYALESALREQKLVLIDVAPSDVRKLLESKQPYSRTQELEIFQHEIGSLLPWFVLSAEIVCGRTPSDLCATIELAFKETSSAESRSYRQGVSLWQTVAKQWLRILRDAGETTAFTHDTFESGLAHLKDRLWPDTLISLCRVAARADKLEALAIQFATGAYEALETSRDDAETRAHSYLMLARAILTVSRAEAGAYFDRAVEIANRIGDENLDRWAALLNLADAAAERETPRPETAYRLSRVAELTYEYVARDKHFDWGGTIAALTDLCAASALTILGRWRDRRFGNPGRLLPLAIYRLMEQGRLPAKTSVAFAGLDAEWKRLEDLKRVVAAEADQIRRIAAAEIAYRYMRTEPYSETTWLEIGELDRTYGLKFQDIDRLILASRDGGSSAKGTTAPASAPVRRERRAPDWDVIFLGVDLTNSNALRTVYASLCTYDPPYEFTTFFSQAFARVKVGRQSELVAAIAAWPDFGFFELRCMLDGIPSPMPKQVSFRNIVRDAVLSACRREPGKVQRRSSYPLIPFRKLAQEGLVPDRDIVRATLEGFEAQVDTLSTGGLFRLVEPLAACLSPAEADEALNYGLDLLEDVLRPEDGDGAWRPDLQPPSSLMCAVAGYIWSGLGSPVAAERWQYAHIVRSVIALEWTELLKPLISWAEGGDAGPFVDQGLEFYIWHARQWMLIGLCRGGLDNPAALLPAKPLLSLWIAQEHVLIRALATQALRSLCTVGDMSDDEAAELDIINRPSLPGEIYSGWIKPVKEEAEASEEGLVDEQKYHFGMDINSYWFRPLGRVFGLDEKAIDRRARQAVRRMGWTLGGWRDDARHTRKIFADREAVHSHGTLPDTDDLRAYHAYHAVMLVAAVLLKERGVWRRNEADQDEFQEWLSKYLLTQGDGQWLADRRDPRLVSDPPPAQGYGDKFWPWTVTSAYLDQQLVADDGMTVLWGHWTGGGDEHNETVSVRSAIVSRAGAEALATALQTAPELGYFALPHAGELDNEKAGTFELTGWVTNEYVSARLDREDPWAKSLNYPGLSPSEQVIAKLSLVASTDGRLWTSATGGKLRSENWTFVQGSGREEETVPGSRLSGDSGFLEHLFSQYPDDRLILSVEIRRRPPKYGIDKDSFEPYPQPYARYYVIGADGGAQSL